jgi:hypothetical protein
MQPGGAMGSWGIDPQYQIEANYDYLRDKKTLSG